MVVPIPNDPFLDFNGPETSESQLKEEAFSMDYKGPVAAVVYGMGGVGKTSAIGGVWRLEAAAKRLLACVLFMSLGADA